ncbi:MAG TPA: S9 family peptidase [Microscillaceae bacterium]|nr:S9 family peptidase [Microscillaceae bacterium]
MKKLLLVLLVSSLYSYLIAQDSSTPLSATEKITVDRLFLTNDFDLDYFRQPRWINNGEAYTSLERSGRYPNAREIVQYDTRSGKRTVLVSAQQLIPAGQSKPLYISNYTWSPNKAQLLIFTNTQRVWRYHTRGDYWVLSLKSKKLIQLGKNLPTSSLMFAKFSPNSQQVAYVSKHNVYVEDLASQKTTQLTTSGTDRLINGTFDWAYEEEFDARDGFRWSPDGSQIAFWQVDARNIRNFYMINNTDSTYSHLIPVQYPKVGETPSACRIGIIDLKSQQKKWLDIPGNNRQHYLPRMMYEKNTNTLLVQQVNRKQNHLKVWRCNTTTGKAAKIYEEKEKAWIDVVSQDDWKWLKKGQDFTWVTEKDGWRHVYSISKDGKKQRLITQGNFDAVNVLEIDPKGGYCYFIASPENPTQRYLYRAPIYKKGKAVRLTPQNQAGTHQYNIAPGGKYALHTYSTANQPPMTELISLPNHKVIKTLVTNQKVKQLMTKLKIKPIEFFKIKTQDNVQMEGMMIKPPNFDASKKYPVLFYVYGEPWGQTAKDVWSWRNWWFHSLAQQGYLVITIDNRGTPSPKGRQWRKSIYRKIGVVNSRDQAMGAKEIMKWKFVDPDRIGVWGWSGGGSMTLNLLFRYPEIYKTGMSVAPVSNQLYYDNIYQERYMGLVTENKEDFLEGSPITYAKNLKGNLLLVHGTGDDNVHYQNAEALINELIKHNKVFQVMPYPNRSHGIYEGKNTSRHLYTTLTQYLLRNLKAGGK